MVAQRRNKQPLPAEETAEVSSPRLRSSSVRQPKITSVQEKDESRTPIPKLRLRRSLLEKAVIKAAAEQPETPTRTSRRNTPRTLPRKSSKQDEEVKIGSKTEDARTPIPVVRVRKSLLRRNGWKDSPVRKLDIEEKENESSSSSSSSDDSESEAEVSLVSSSCPETETEESEAEGQEDEEKRRNTKAKSKRVSGKTPISKRATVGRGAPKRKSTEKSNTDAKENVDSSSLRAKVLKKQANKHLLVPDRSVVPLKGREEEFATMRDSILCAIKEEKPLTVYLGGAPGTGKTATVKLLIEAMAPIMDSCVINCASVGTQSQLLSQVHQQLEIEGRSTLAHFTAYLESLSRPLLLVLDEIDHLTSKHNSILYSVFRWPEQITAKLFVIGIANSVDLTERVLPKLKLCTPPICVIFAPYRKEQLTAILADNLAKGEGKMDDKAVELCARKVAAVSGDLRSALHVMNQAKMASIPGTPSGCREVLSALNSVYSSPISRAKLPLQPRVLLAVCLQMSANKKTCLTRTALFSAYYKACESVKIPPLQSDDLHVAMDTLEAQSFVALQGDKIRLRVDVPTARSAIADMHMIEAIGRMKF